MKNKEYKQQEVLRAGWSQKTPGSGYWHRRNSSVYVSLDEAFDNERLFPEQVRKALQLAGVRDMGRRELNDDSVNAQIAQQIKGVVTGQEYIPGLATPLRTTPPFDPQTVGEMVNLALEKAAEFPPKTWVPPVSLEAPKPNPRFKTTSNGVYAFVVDKWSGRSIWKVKINDAQYPLAIAERACLRYNKGLDKLPAEEAALPPIGPISSFALNNLRDNIKNEIAFLRKIQRELYSPPFNKNWENVRALLNTGTTQAKAACFRFVPIEILNALGIKKESCTP